MKMLPTVVPMKSDHKVSTLPTVKVELRQENRDRKAGRVPITLEIRSNETILPEAASDYEVGLLKFVTAFDVPSFHIPEDKALEFKFWEEYIHPSGFPDFRNLSTATMTGSFHGIRGFCDKFNEAHMFRGKPTLKMMYDEPNGSVDIKFVHMPDVNGGGEVMCMSVNEEGKRFLGSIFPITDDKVEVGMNKMLYTLKEYTTNNVYKFKHNDFVMSYTYDDTYSKFYNFDHIQLMTDLPINQTLGTAGNDIIKISTLGNITTNPSVKDAYERGGLLHLPNFKIISSLTSDTPLTNFKITPYIFYRTGHSERMTLSSGSSCYALIEFTPREKL